MDNDSITDLFQGLGPVSIRRMFGGKGIYFNGLIIAIDLFDEIMLKADAIAAAEFEAAGCRQWIYTHRKSSKPVAMPYWSVPDGAMDDPDEMAAWALKSYHAAVRSQGGSRYRESRADDGEGGAA